MLNLSPVKREFRVSEEQLAVVNTCVSVQSDSSPSYTNKDGGHGHTFVLLLY